MTATMACATSTHLRTKMHPTLTSILDFAHDEFRLDKHARQTNFPNIDPFYRNELANFSQEFKILVTRLVKLKLARLL